MRSTQKQSSPGNIHAADLAAAAAGKALAAAAANRSSDRLEKQIAAQLAGYPDPMSRTDLRRACRIGTRTSLYLLQSGLVPCTHTGKKTRCYKIAKADAAEYLRRREQEPEYYTAPSGWYKNYPTHKPSTRSLTGTLVLTDTARQHLHRWYEQQLSTLPDMLDTAQIAQLTGYSRSVVSRWCREGQLKSLLQHPKWMIPKAWLLEFLTSEAYNNIARKSQQHNAVIQAVAKPRSEER